MSMDVCQGKVQVCFRNFFPRLPLIPDMCELINFSMFRVGFLHVLTEVKVI